MIRSLEDMARRDIEAYMQPLYIGGKHIRDGWPVHVATRKAAAAHWDCWARADLIRKVGAKMETETIEGGKR